MARQLFGTDGIRGVAGEYPLDAATAYAFGRALGGWAARHGEHAEVVIGMDTRESGPWLAETVAGGLAACGVKTRFAGLITTPGVAYLTRTRDFVAGVMISASHNPYHDNGLKVFDHSGFKLPDDQELLLEKDIFAMLAEKPVVATLKLEADETLDRAYLDYLETTVVGRLDGKKLVIDCAHGASAHLAPELFRELGAEVVAIGCEPNGKNINDGVGALHTDNVKKKVLELGADAGLAFDGDADRCMIISPSGKLIDGDHMLLLCARHLQRTGHLKQPVVVATVMSNLGLQRVLEKAGIEMLRTPVGDKYVLEEMVRRDAQIGGEQSGHVIFREWATTGDGLLTALRALEAVQATGKTLDELTADFIVFPQVLVNVRVKDKKPIDQLPTVQDEILEAEKAFDGAGRVLVRFSGTEPLARVMVEGDDEVKVRHWAKKIAGTLELALAG